MVYLIQTAPMSASSAANAHQSYTMGYIPRSVSIEYANRMQIVVRIWQMLAISQSEKQTDPQITYSFKEKEKLSHGNGGTPIWGP